MVVETSWSPCSRSSTPGCRQEVAFRILTDVSGPFFTVVTEVEVENLTTWETKFSESMAQPWMGEWFGRMTELVDSGSREFYTVVE